MALPTPSLKTNAGRTRLKSGPLSKHILNKSLVTSPQVEAGSVVSISEIFREIAELQTKWSSENTAEMKKRGQLIRKSAPDFFRNELGRLQAAVNPFGSDLNIEGRDGIGRKTPAPWVRFYSDVLSPSATNGFYVVIHFSTDGNRCFFTLGTGTSTWVAARGDLIPDKVEDIQRRVDWIRSILRRSNSNLSKFNDTISIGSKLELPKRFEDGTALCKTVHVDDLNDPLVIEIVEELLGFLSKIYTSVEKMEHLPDSEALLIQSESIVSEKHRGRSRGQGRGLNAEQRKAVELRAMDVAKKALESEGYKVTDKSAKNSYDFLAVRADQELKVEVKGTTSPRCDAVQMTRNEVELHHSEVGKTALAIVSGIVLKDSGNIIKGIGGELELLNPWDVDCWGFEPATYIVKRRT